MREPNRGNHGALALLWYAIFKPVFQEQVSHMCVPGTRGVGGVGEEAPELQKYPALQAATGLGRGKKEREGVRI